MKQPLLPLRLLTRPQTGLRLRLGLLAVLLGLAFTAQAQVQVVSTNPVRNTNLAPRSTNVALTYSGSAPVSSAVRVFSQQAGGRKAGTSSTSGNTLTLNPTVDFKPGEKVFVTSVGNSTARPSVYQFTTQAGAGPGTFNGGSEVSVGNFPASVAAADVDSDGDLDLLVATSTDPGMVSVRLNNGRGSFSGSQQVGVGKNPSSVAAADVDGDGDLDLLSASSGSGTVSVRLNNGQGSFSGSQEVSVGSRPLSVATADVDGDGDLDLLAANFDSNTISVRFNAGTGSFGNGSDVPVGSSPVSVVAADADGDGDLDIYAANNASNSVSVRLNNGQGSFGSGREVPVGSQPFSLALADVDADGTLDLLVANRDGNTVSVIPNNSRGLSSTVAVGLTPNSVAAADVDGDGDLDLLVANYNSSSISVRLNNGQGSFSGSQEVSVGAVPYNLLAADVDNDGDLDLLTANLYGNSVSVRLNQVPSPSISSFTPGSGVVGTSITVTGTNFTGATSVTFNGTAATFTVNSATELIATVPPSATTGPIAVTTPSGTGISATPFTVLLTVTSTNPVRNTNLAPRPTNVTLTYNRPVDPAAMPVVRVFSQQAGGRKAGTSSTSGNTLTLNPTVDFKPGETVSVTSVGSTVVSPYVYQFTTRAGAGPGTFNGGAEVSVGRGPRGVTTADVDGDGDLDLLAANLNDNTVSVRLNNGQASFANSGQNVSAGTPTSVAAADVDGDGDLDLLATNEDGNSVTVRLNNGAGTFSNAPDVSVGFRPYGVVAVDMDGDGDLDILTANYGSNSVSVRLNNGQGSFANSGQDVPVGNITVSVAAADVDSDGDLDLLIANSTNNSVSVRLNNGNGTFSNAPAVSVGNAPSYVTAADIDGDGDLDILTANDGTASVRLNNGTGSFGPGSDFPVGDLPTSIVAADVDGDGDLDLLVNNYGGSIYNSGTVSLRLNNGTGTFSNAPDVSVGNAPRSMAVADLDNDGDLDILTANYTGLNQVSVRLNQVPAPIISGLTPGSGVVGTRVTVTGTNFTGATRVAFNGVAASTFIVNSATELVTTVPAGATTGPISITTPLGTGTSSTPFTVLLTIASTSPARNTNLAPRATNVTLTYSQPIAPGAVPAVRVFSQQAGGRKASTTTSSSNTVTVDPTTNFQPGETVFVTSAGSASAAPYLYQFTSQAGAGPGTFSGGTDLAVGSGPQGVTTADVNNDGILDLVVSKLGNAVGVHLGSGQGTFGSAQNLTLPGSYTRVRTADVNGDGNLDVLATSGGGTVSVRLGNGTGSFSGTQEVPVETNSQDLTLTDLDGDGDLDLATANGSSNTVNVRLNDGTGTFSGTASYAPGPIQLYSVVAGDVDNDGDLDLLTGSANVGQVAVLLNNGAGTFSAGPLVTIAAATYHLALADVDGDGNLDLLATASTTVSVRRGNGQGGFSGTQEISVGGSNISGLALADVEGDGDLDVLATLFDDRTVSVRLNDGQGTFTGSQQVSVGQNNNSLAVADVDNDGDLDILTTSFLPDGTVNVRLNQVPAAAAPTLVSFAPASGPVGTSVTLTGSGFVGTTSVSFNGTNAPGFVVDSDTQLTVRVPVGATTGVLAVTTPAGMATSTTPFTVTFAPVVTTTAGSTTAPEQVATVVDAGLTLTNASTLATATVRLSSGLVPAEDVLTFTPAGNITGTYDAPTGVLALTSAAPNATLADWQVVLRSISYRNASDNPTTANRTVSFVVNDGTLSSVPAVKPLNVQAVNDAPSVVTDANSDANMVVENAPAGTLVGLTALATDADSPTVTYSLTNNAGGRFTIEANTGIVRVGATALDFETAASYVITVQASDGTLASSASFTVQITDVNEAPVIANQTFSVTAGSPNGTVVGTVAATDADAGTILTYSILSGNTNGVFTLVGNQLRVANAASLGTATYNLSVQAADNGSPSLASAATITVTITPLPCQAPTAVTVSNITSSTALVSFTGSSAAGAYTVTYTPSGGTAQTLLGSASPLNLSGLLANTAYTLTVRSNCTSGQTATSAVVRFTTACAAPTVAAPANQTVPIPSGQTSASVSFAATATGTPAPTISYSLNGALITSPYRFPVGTSTVTVTATNCGGTATQSFTVTVTTSSAASVRVLYQNGDLGQPTNNVIKPNLQLINDGSTAVPYQELTVRYWLTVENYTALATSVYYAPLGASQISMRYVALPTPRQGAFGYVEYSFLPGAGSLAARGTSGPIQTGINKQDWTNFDETDDYSYATSSDFTINTRITVYRNGTLVGGTEPAPVAASRLLKVYAENKNSNSTTNTISLWLQVGNVGNVAVDYQDITVRYWFSPDGTSPLVYTVDYTPLGNNNVLLTTGQQNGETYMQMSFAPSLGTFAPSNNTGNIQLRINKADWSNFNQGKDYSYRPAAPMAEHPRMTVYVRGQLVYGTEPGPGARTASAAVLATTSGAAPAMSLESYPNPFSEEVQLDFRLVHTDAYTLAVYDLQGRLIELLSGGNAPAGELRQVRWQAARYPTGVYLVRLSTASGVKVLKLVKQ